MGKGSNPERISCSLIAIFLLGCCWFVAGMLLKLATWQQGDSKDSATTLQQIVVFTVAIL
jgi:hypothetical protein